MIGNKVQRRRERKDGEMEKKKNKCISVPNNVDDVKNN